MRTRRLSPEKRKLLNRFYFYLKGKRYSQSTVNSYTYLVADFIEYVNEKETDQINNADVDRYLGHVFEPKGHSISTQRQFISGLKLFKAFCPECKIDQLELKRPKRDQRLPVVLTKQEVIELIRCTRNIKHRAIIALLYSSGLRVGELINLKLMDLDIERRQIHVKNAKGRKDRYVILSQSILPLLQNYFFTFKPVTFFAEGGRGKPYSASSIRKFMKGSSKAAGITKRVTPHTLRHSYATHLLEQGVNLRHIQSLLGHARPETTMVYTRVMKKDLLAIESPLDTILKQLRDVSGYDDQKFLISRDL